MRSNRVNKTLRWLVCLTLMGFLSACSTIQVGKDFDLAAFENGVRAGVTTRADVQGWLGSPKGNGIALDNDGSRYEEWVYFYGRGRMPNMQASGIKLLQVRFDLGGVVRSYNWSDSQ